MRYILTGDLISCPLTAATISRQYRPSFMTYCSSKVKNAACARNMNSLDLISKHNELFWSYTKYLWLIKKLKANANLMKTGKKSAKDCLI